MELHVHGNPLLTLEEKVLFKTGMQNKQTEITAFKTKVYLFGCQSLQAESDHQ